MKQFVSMILLAGTVGKRFHPQRMHYSTPNDKSLCWRSATQMLLIGCACVAWIGFVAQSSAESSDPALQQLDRQSRDVLKREIEAQKAALDRAMRKMITSYDLTLQANAITQTLDRDARFQQWLDNKGINRKEPTKEERTLIFDEMREYLRSTSKLKPEVIAWMRMLEKFPVASWNVLMAECRLIQEKRPDDLPPKFIMILSESQRNERDYEEWLSMIKDAHRAGKDSGEKSLFLMLAWFHIPRLEKAGFGKPILESLANWLNSLEKSAVDPELAKRIAFCQWAVATARGQRAEAAEYAKDSALRVWAPTWLVSAGKVERAREMVRELKALPDLSDQERNILATIEGLLGRIPK